MVAYDQLFNTSCGLKGDNLTLSDLVSAMGKNLRHFHFIVAVVCHDGSIAHCTVGQETSLISYKILKYKTLSNCALTLGS